MMLRRLETQAASGDRDAALQLLTHAKRRGELVVCLRHLWAIDPHDVVVDGVYADGSGRQRMTLSSARDRLSGPMGSFNYRLTMALPVPGLSLPRWTDELAVAWVRECAEHALDTCVPRDAHDAGVLAEARSALAADRAGDGDPYPNRWTAYGRQTSVARALDAAGFAVGPNRIGSLAIRLGVEAQSAAAVAAGLSGVDGHRAAVRWQVERLWWHLTKAAPDDAADAPGRAS